MNTKPVAETDVARATRCAAGASSIVADPPGTLGAGPEFRLIRVASKNQRPVISVILLNRDGARWLPRCLDSIRAQTMIGDVELVLVDNGSTDNSIELACGLMAHLPTACLVQSAANLGFCEGNNLGARVARGEFLFFLNNDTWLEPDCLETLVRETREKAAAAATPWVLNYGDNTHQDLGFFGFDIFGLPSPSRAVETTREIFIPGGCSYLIQAKVFHEVGMFDPAFFMYSEDVELSWRVWIAGYRIIGVPRARLHHRGAAGVNPAGGERTLEFRTTDRKRFLTNRNCLLTLLKNGQHLIVLTALPLIVYLFLEAIVGAVLLRRWSFAKATLIDALRDCWKLRGHLRLERKRVAQWRKRTDLWMLRHFLKIPFNRWFEVKRLFSFGIPHVDCQ